jgi:hypothetical protein
MREKIPAGGIGSMPAHILFCRQSIIDNRRSDIAKPDDLVAGEEFSGGRSPRCRTARRLVVFADVPIGFTRQPLHRQRAGYDLPERNFRLGRASFYGVRPWCPFARPDILLYDAHQIELCQSICTVSLVVRRRAFEELI